jgi:DNA-binding beta-propeller fold protein YncE
MRLACIALRTAALSILMACAAAGCATTGSSSPNRRKTGAFAVTARYGARSLELNGTRGLAIAPDGNLYVTDLSQRVTVVSPDGRVLRRWGRRGRGPGEFHFVSTDPTDPRDIHAALAVGAHGTVYVSDSGNARVEEFTPTGHFLRQFGGPGADQGGFSGTFDLAVDRAGDVYVLDDGRPGVVTKFSPAGKVVWQVGGAASSNRDLTGHLHLASVDPHGRLVMVDDDLGRVVYLDRNGHEVDAFTSRGRGFPPSQGGCDVTVDVVGNTYVTGCGGGAQCPAPVCAGTVVFDRAHRLIAEWASRRLPLRRSPRFGPRGEAFTLATDGSLIRLRVTVKHR